jgi:hypothetical protein
MEEGWHEVQSISESRLCKTYSRSAASRQPFKYVQSYDYIIMSGEIIVVNYCSILSVSVLSDFLIVCILVDVYFS